MIKDLSEVSYENILQFEVVLSSASGEGLKVKFDLQKELITWNDGYMWNNNFMRGISTENLAYLKEELPKTNMLEWMIKYNKGDMDDVGHPTANPSIWQIRVFFDNGETLSSTSCQHFPNDWNSLKELIEKLTSCTFRLR
ncbi:MAG: hypothetical protein J6U54_09450 [Clostridiales bacterium]|nr:hypothetical protein [Clostridiales bacterium]